MESFAVAVKSFIVNDEGQLLIIKRKDDNPHKPGVWEIPGGRLAPGENPFEGLKREAREETGLDIEIMNPLRVHHFIRDDGQRITMITFLCKPLSGSLDVAREHTEHEWISIGDSINKLDRNFHEEVDIFKRLFSKNDGGWITDASRV